MFEKLLVGVDGASGGRDAIMLAKVLAPAHARVVLANISDGPGMLGRGGGLALATGRQEAERLLADEREAAGIEAESIVHFGGSPAKALHELAEREAAGLLVVGSSRRGPIGRALLGDRTLAALNGSPCAIAIAPHGYAAGEHRPLTRIGVGYDGSVESAPALAAARELAERHRATVCALAVVGLQSVPPSQAIPADWTMSTDDAIRAQRSRLAAIKGIDADVTYGDPAEELAAFAQHLDVLIVGSRGHGPVGRLLNGSVSTYLARHSPCPVVVLPR